jgi:hypothetical protein
MRSMIITLFVLAVFEFHDLQVEALSIPGDVRKR